MSKLIFDAAKDDWSVKDGGPRRLVITEGRAADAELLLTPAERVAAAELERAIAAERLAAAKAEAAALEEDAARGREVVSGARKGGESEKRRKLTYEQRAEAKAARDHLIERGHTKNDANGLIAAGYGVHARTIDRL